MIECMFSLSGLGRTGVLLACYLIYASRIEADEAIRYVRQKRPNAVQTRGQIMIVYEFEHFLKPFASIFSLRLVFSLLNGESPNSC